jgi:DNA mismatch endonuclease (patch repair protein)
MPERLPRPVVKCSESDVVQNKGVDVAHLTKGCSASYEGMVDTLDPVARSARMALVKGVNTKPELTVRRVVHSMGFRYRLHVKVLPGRPDLVFPRLGKVIFVQGCFWHRHRRSTCRLARTPKSRIEFWEQKLEGNHQRDLRNKRLLRSAGWLVLEVWECELKNEDALARRLRYFLENDIT